MTYHVLVVKGRGDGKRIGVPTINFQIPQGFAEQQGIYAGWVRIDGTAYPAAFHYGPAPVFGVETSSLEAHLLDLLPPGIPPAAEIELVRFLREVRSFESIGALQEQVAEDIRRAKRILGC